MPKISLSKKIAAKVLKNFQNNPEPVFFVLDIVFIFLAVLFSFLLRFDGKIPAEMQDVFWAFSFLAIVLTVPVFFLHRLHRLSWKYVSITDLPNIAVAVISSSLILGASLFILRDRFLFAGFPRSIIFIYTILLLLFIGGLRFSKRIYWQIIRTRGGGFKIKEFSLPLTEKVLTEKQIKTVFITGGAGYVGSTLSRQLLKEGFNVKVFDKLIFGSESIDELKKLPNFQLIQGDIFDTPLLVKSLSDVDAVVNLAAIVGEPACVAKKDVALQTNYLGTVYLARLCKALGIKRFVHASTCSTYGQQDEKASAGEESALFPVDFYGETKIYAERELMKLMDNNFTPTIFRFSTIFGLSPRMRFDLIVNTLIKKAVKDKEIFIFGGRQWRPLIHVSDASRALVLALKSPLSKVGNQIFNVGGDNGNYTVAALGDLAKECVPDVVIKTINDIDDKRSYRVRFAKIEKILGFKPEKSVKDGMIEIRDAINRGQFKDLEDKKYYNHLV